MKKPRTELDAFVSIVWLGIFISNIYVESEVDHDKTLQFPVLRASKSFSPTLYITFYIHKSYMK